MSKYILREEGCNPFELTKEEYEEFAEMVRQNRAKEFVRKSADLLTLLEVKRQKPLLEKD